MKTEYICPFCFTHHRISEVMFRCQNRPEKCTWQIDKLLQDELGINETQPIVFAPGSGRGNVMPHEANCPDCKMISRKRICPSCHWELPYTINDHADLIIAVIGGKNAGKSHYIAVLIEQIKRQIAPIYHCHFQPVNDLTMEQYRERFYHPIYTRRETLRGTVSATADSSVRIPLIYSLRFRQKGFLGKEKSVCVTLVFFDTAGEDLDTEDLMATQNKYIYNAAGIILLLDPLQLLAVRRQIPQPDLLPPETTEIEDIIARCANLIRKAQQLGLTQKIQIPIALSFSKTDTLQTLLDPGSPLNYPSKHLEEAYFHQREFQDLHMEIEGLLHDWDSAYLIEQVAGNFQHYGLFGLSALGAPPENGTHIVKHRPHRVEDPFLWLLWQNNVIKARKK